jgi:ubiquinone/menaquinone biosynthesis C-methylase UbiE
MSRNHAEFDEYSQSYQLEIEKAISQYGGQHDYFLKCKIDCLHRFAQTHFNPSMALRVLDVGCGPGITTHLMAQRFNAVTGLDVSSGLLEYARGHYSNCEFVHYDGSHMPFAQDAFDMVVAINVFHHIPPDHRDAIVKEMCRVVRAGGIVSIIEHNPYNPVTLRVVRSCAFDKDAILLKSRETECRLESVGLTGIQTRFILFVPFAGRLAFITEKLLGWLPLGAQYAAFGIKPC